MIVSYTSTCQTIKQHLEHVGTWKQILQSYIWMYDAHAVNKIDNYQLSYKLTINTFLFVFDNISCVPIKLWEYENDVDTIQC